MAVPKYHELFNPTLNALKSLGGSASMAELDEEVKQRLGLTEEDAAQSHSGGKTELQYRLTWAGSYLKAYGLIDNSERGTWLLTVRGKDTDHVNSREVIRSTRQPSRHRRAIPVAEDAEPPEVEAAHA